MVNHYIWSWLYTQRLWLISSWMAWVIDDFSSHPGSCSGMLKFFWPPPCAPGRVAAPWYTSLLSTIDWLVHTELILQWMTVAHQTITWFQSKKFTLLAWKCDQAKRKELTSRRKFGLREALSQVAPLFCSGPQRIDRALAFFGITWWRLEGCQSTCQNPTCKLILSAFPRHSSAKPRNGTPIFSGKVLHDSSAVSWFCTCSILKQLWVRSWLPTTNQILLAHWPSPA